MSFTELVSDHGYTALALGLLVEGETVLLAAAFAAYRGLLALPNVIVIAFVVSSIIDHLLFWLGHRQGPRVKQRYSFVGRAASRVDPWLHRHQAWLVITMRFMIGLRTAAPILIGAAGISPWRFTGLNLMGAALWAVCVGCAGYLFGPAIEQAVYWLQTHPGWVIAVLIALGSLLFLSMRSRSTSPRERPSA